MASSFLYVVVRFLLETLIVRSRSEARLRAEVLALRHQLAVLERQVGRPRWQPTDRQVAAGFCPVAKCSEPISSCSLGRWLAKLFEQRPEAVAIKLALRTLPADSLILSVLADAATSVGCI